MQKSMEFTGKNEDAAIAAALEQLGLSREEVSVEVLELAKPGFLGIGGTLAKVKVTFEAPDEPEETVSAPVEKKVAGKKAAKEEEPAAMGVYIIANSVFSTIQELILGKMLKKDYEAAAEARRLRGIEEKEEEKRLRREKAERKALEAEEAKKNKGKKKEPEADDKMTPEQRDAAREGMRQYARGRAYDPNRYGGVTPYTDPSPRARSEEPQEPWEDKTKD